MRKRGAQAATTEMGWMGAEDPPRIPGRDSIGRVAGTLREEDSALKR